MKRITMASLGDQGRFGNQIFDVQKEFYVFRNFSTNVRKDLLTDSWTPETATTAKYPQLEVIITPYSAGSHIYGVCSYGQLAVVDPGHETVRAGGEPVHDHRILGSGSGPAGGERVRCGW